MFKIPLLMSVIKELEKECNGSNKETESVINTCNLLLRYVEVDKELKETRNVIRKKSSDLSLSRKIHELCVEKEKIRKMLVLSSN